MPNQHPKFGQALLTETPQKFVKVFEIEKVNGDEIPTPRQFKSLVDAQGKRLHPL